MKKTITSYTHYNFIDKDPIIDRIATIVKGMGLSYKEVALMSGMHYSTIRALFIGKTRNPQFSTVARIVIGLGQDDLPVVAQTQRRARTKLKVVT
jgi:transcriptional regulator with XRE-family HTH domain